MRDLRMAVKAEYFYQIRDGHKKAEYRLRTDYWRKRLEHQNYDTVTITLGYPHRDSVDRIITFPYRGFTKIIIIHDHFGSEPVAVYSIKLVDKRRIKR